MTEVEDGDVVRDLGRRGGRVPGFYQTTVHRDRGETVPSKVVCLSVDEVYTCSGERNGRGPNILSAVVRSTDKESRGNYCEEGSELHGGKGLRSAGQRGVSFEVVHGIYTGEREAVWTTPDHHPKKSVQRS